MAKTNLQQEISVELDENQVEFRTYEDENQKKSTKNPHLISTTTGGMENSCYSCLLGFGMVGLIIGISTTGLFYASKTNDFVLSVLGHLILALGITSILLGCIWRYYRKRRKTKINEDLAELFYENQQKKCRL